MARATSNRIEKKGCYHLLAFALGYLSTVAVIGIVLYAMFTIIVLPVFNELGDKIEELKGQISFYSR
jgi:hypothetical protein